jgi:DNA-binding NarL/FixJ family response regulator
MGKLFVTENEKGLLSILKKGKSRKDASTERNVSTGTTDSEMNIIFKKFNVHSLQELWNELKDNDIDIP